MDKEILDKYLDGLISYPFQKKDKEYILDYITNLQQENELLKEQIKELRKSIIDCYYTMTGLDTINDYELNKDIEVL